jgi:hypothetical protein
MSLLIYVFVAGAFGLIGWHLYEFGVGVSDISVGNLRRFC